MDEVAVNPTTGLPNLLTFLNQAGKDPSQQETVKRNVPKMFEILPKAMETLKESNAKQVFAACAVIEQCVKVHNEATTGRQISTEPAIDAESLKACLRNLVTLLQKAQEKGAKTFAEDSMECDPASKEAKAIALATVAIFKLQGHATECKEEFKKSGGIAIALKAMETQDSGIKRDSMQALALLLSLFVDNSPDNVESFIAGGGTFVFVKYVEDASKYDVPKEMQTHCRAVLQSCLQHGLMARQMSDGNVMTIQKALAKPVRSASK